MSFDVYSYGVVSSSTLYGIRDAYPSAEGYAEIKDIQHMVGGEAANSSIVLSRLGVKVRLDGNWLGDNESGQRTKELLSGHGIDTSRLPLKSGFRGVQEAVIAAQDTRTIFGTYGQLLEGGSWNEPVEQDITSAKVVSLDPFFADPARRAAQIAFNAGIPVVTVDCRYDDPLLEHVSAVVVAESYIRENYPERDPEELFRQYQAVSNGLIIFTFGDAPVWYARPGESMRFFQPYSIDPVDTTGGGDSFRAGIVYGFLRGWDDDRTVAFAAAVAAIACTRFPGVMNAPTYGEVIEFIERCHA
jgi:sugar/nucleoside kinase (ribokinase family)